MSLKNIDVLLLKAFGNANPSKGDLTSGSVDNIAKVDNSDNYSGDLKDSSGNVLVSGATWKPGNFKGVMGLDGSFAPVEQETAGTTVGLFKKSDGSLYFVLNKSATVDTVNSLSGYEFTADQLTIDQTNNQLVFSTYLFTENVPTTFIEDAWVTHVDLPTS